MPFSFGNKSRVLDVSESCKHFGISELVGVVMKRGELKCSKEGEPTRQ